MFESLPAGVVFGAVGLGLLHGAEPGHGWPVAATYALEKSNKWASGLAASVILGVGHLVSSLAVVAAFFLLKSSVGLESAWWLDYLAGGLLILLGVHEYRSGHSHAHGEGHDHSHHEQGHSHHDHSHHDHSHHDHGEGEHGQTHTKHDAELDGPRGSSHIHPPNDERADGILARIGALLPSGSGGHSHDDESLAEAADRGLWSIAGTAFVLGFAHEEEFEIIGLCAGSSLCLELMTAYAAAVVVGIVALTLLLVAGYERYEDRVQRWADHFPTVSALVLVTMGLGFVFGVL